MVGGAGNAPVVTSDSYFRHRFTDRQPEHLPKWLRGWESHPPEEVYEASLCTLVEFPAMKWWSRRVTLPHELACRASAFLVCHDPIEIGKPPWCCPRQAEFWRLCCTSWCAAYWNSGCAEVRETKLHLEKLVRLPGIAPRRPPWQEGILAVKSQPHGK